MTKKQHHENLRKPPVIEAVFDIAISEDDSFDCKNLSMDEKKFRDLFPIEEKIQKREINISLDTEKEELKHQSSSDHHLGFSYRSEDKEALAQFRLNGFSYHKLHPYQGWDNALSSAFKYWPRYKKKMRNLKVVRLGLRFINIIEINDREENLTNDLRMVLKPKKGSLRQIEYQYILEFEDYDCTAIVKFYPTTPASVYPKNEFSKKFVLDIDVVKTNIMEEIGDEKIKELFSEMREVKNIIFFGTLTEKVLRNYR